MAIGSVFGGSGGGGSGNITITGDSGGSLTGNSFTFTGGSTGLTFSGSGSTETLTGVLLVPHGGTGDSSFTPYSVICGGTTSTGNLQNVTGVGTAGQILTSNGAGSLPTWQTGASTSISITGDSGGTITGSSFIFTGGTTGLTFSGSGTTESLIGTVNVAHGGTGDTSFTAYSLIAGGTTSTGPLQNISGVGTSGQFLTSNGASALPTWQTAPASSIMFSGDTGTTFSSSAVTIRSNNAANACGSSVLFNAATPDITLQVTDSNTNTLLGNLAGKAGITGTANTGFGYKTLAALTSGSYNTAFGVEALNSITTGTNSTAMGYFALQDCTTGGNNTAFGYGAMANTTIGANNTAFGFGALLNNVSGNFNSAFGDSALNNVNTGVENIAMGVGALMDVTSGGQNVGMGVLSLNTVVTGSYNSALGFSAGSNYTSSESSNVMISNFGTVGESNVIRIGTQGTGNGQQNACYVAGIAGVTTVSSSVVAGLATATGQLVQTTITAGTGISVSSSAGAITISTTGTTTLSFTSVNHTASPYTVLATDDVLGCQTSTGIITIKLPNAPVTGRVYYVKDSNGASATNNISVTTVGGTVTIDGLTTYTVSTNYESLMVIFDGTNYEVL